MSRLIKTLHLAFLALKKVNRQSLVLPALLLSLVLFVPGVVSAAEDRWQDVARIVAVGDAHGDYDNFITVLRDTGVINRRGNWIGGETHLVQLGDVPDRGPDTDKIIALLRKLEQQALQDGGRVHALIGNHEAMNMLGDLRYVDPGEYDALRTSNSRRLRDEVYKLDVERRQAADPEFKADDDFRKQWEREVPLGAIEHRYAWSPQGDFGAWVLQHNAIIRINRTLFLHAGISVDTVSQDITAMNEQIRSELAGNLSAEAGLSEQENGPLWYRGLATNPPETELPLLEQILVNYDVDRVVIAHTPGLGTIVPRFDSRVLVVDTGLSASYGGHLGALLIEGGRATTLQRGVSIAVPQSDAGLLEYYRAVAEVERDVPALRAMITTLEAAL